MAADEALDTLFDEANGHLALGELVGELREAIGCGLKAVTLRPNDLLAWTSLSQMYVRDGNIPEAESAKANARILSLGGKVVR
ncbi:MAG: hypothetical protein NTU84_11775 [Verrucomicrobia bacterium]|nr:hypothetical protein [Verrucomicrobiota bacterium]